MSNYSVLVNVLTCDLIHRYTVNVVHSCWVAWSWWITVCLSAFISVLIQHKQSMRFLRLMTDPRPAYLMLRPVFLLSSPVVACVVSVPYLITFWCFRKVICIVLAP